MDENHTINMIERVTVRKFDKTVEDDPAEPFEQITQETITAVSMSDALLMGWKPKAEVEATATVHLGVGDGGGHVGD